MTSGHLLSCFREEGPVRLPIKDHLEGLIGHDHFRRPYDLGPEDPEGLKVAVPCYALAKPVPHGHRNGCPVNSHDPITRNLVQLESRHVLGKAGRADVHVAVGLEELGDVPACLGPVLRIIAPDEEEEGNPH